MSGFLLILFSELGDKTFFIALLLSLSKPKAAVFAGTFGALAIMTVISVCPERQLIVICLAVTRMKRQKCDRKFSIDDISLHWGSISVSST